MRHPWLLVAALLLAVLVAVHAPRLQRAWVGESVLAYGFDRCEAHLAADPGPAPTAAARERADNNVGGAGTGRPDRSGGRACPEVGAPCSRVADVRRVGEGCDTVYSQRIAWDTWRRARAAWAARGSTASFLLVDLPAVAVEARALNLLDLVALLWPARLLLPPAAALAALHAGLVALAALSGVVFARLLGASPLAGLAAGVVTGTSAVVLESVQRGQYPQAVLAGALLFFAGLVRLTRAERGGIALVAGGAALACLLYWQNALLLGLGAVLWLGGARLAGPFAARTPARLLAAAGIVLLLCLPAAWPIVRALGAEEKLAVIPWGTALPVSGPGAFDDLLDEVPWYALLSPRGGWIPVLPLLPLALAGLWRRDRLGWALLAACGALLALGPWPVLPGDLGDRVIPDYGSGTRGANLLYLLVYQWVPTASRLRHPLRWATLLVVALAAATAWGVDRLRARFPDHTLLFVLAGLGWAAFVGPWPLREAPFPQPLVDATAGCTALVLPARPRGPVELDDVHRLEALLWLPRAPAEDAATGDDGRPDPALSAWSAEATRSLSAALAGDPAAIGGACVVYEPRWIGPDAEAVHAQLVRTFGAPTTVPETALFSFNGYTRRVEVFRRR